MLKNDAALLLVDLISDFDFEDGEELFERTRVMLPRLKAFKQRCFDAGLPILYVNDPAKAHNGSPEDLFAKVSRTDRGRFILSEIGPAGSETIVFKPQRSGFYDTILEDVLHRTATRHVYVTGITTDICVLFTAHDAYMRKFGVSVPADCTTALKDEYHLQALKFLSRVADADTNCVAGKT